MNVRTPLLISLALVAAMAAFSLWAQGQIAPDSQVPVHWNAFGMADRFGSPLEALWTLPAVAAGMTMLLAGLPFLDPRRENLAASRKFYVVAWLGAVGIMAAVHAAVVSAALGIPIGLELWLMPAIGALFVVLGNYMSKTRSNFFAGVRTPWTLSSDYSWAKTHRTAGVLFILTGVAAIAASLLGGMRAGLIALLAGTLFAIVASVALSYVYWRADPERGL